MRKLVTVLITCLLALGSTAVLSENLTLTGSTTIKPIMDHLGFILNESTRGMDSKEIKLVETVDAKLSDAYRNKVRGYFGELSLSVRPGGSSNGIKSAFEGNTDIGMASRDLKAKENDMKSSLRVINIGSDALVFITAVGNSVKNLSRDQLRRAFLGEVTDWSELDGSGGQIKLIGKGAHHGTYDVFVEKLGLNGKNLAPITYFETEATISAALGQRFDKGLAFASLGALPKSQRGQNYKLLSVDSVAPLKGDSFNSAYSLVRPLNLVLNNGTEISGKFLKFLEFMRSEDGQALIEAHGFVPNQFDKFW